MKQGYSHIVALLDKSGSMKSVQEDTIGGFNTFLDEQKLVPGESTMTLIQFSDACETIYADVPLAHVAHLTKNTYSPSGWTSLNDALAKTINDVGAKLSSKPENERPSQVIVLIMTDGQENTSKEFGGLDGLGRVKEMVKHQQDKYSWKFCFIGSNMDSFSTASGYGISARSTINYTSTPIGTYNAFKSMSRGVVGSRISANNGVVMDSFFENEANSLEVSAKKIDTTDIKAVIDKYTIVNTTEPVKKDNDSATASSTSTMPTND